MLALKLIRENTELVRDGLRKLNATAPIDDIIAAKPKNRADRISPAIRARIVRVGRDRASQLWASRRMTPAPIRLAPRMLQMVRATRRPLPVSSSP